MINVLPSELELVHSILVRHVPGVEVWAYGSRIKKSSKKHSDLDLVLVGEKELPFDVFYNLKEAFKESDLPFRVDVIDWYTLSKGFQKVIQNEYVVLQPAKN